MTSASTYSTLGKWSNVALGIISRKGGDVLVIRRRKRSHYGGYWGLPGGKVKFWENGETAALREIREETGLREEDLTKPLFVGIGMEWLESGGAPVTGEFVKARWQLYYYAMRVRDGATVKRASCRWLERGKVGREELVIPSVSHVIFLEERRQKGELDFFFMEDTIVSRVGKLAMEHWKVQSYRRIEERDSQLIDASVTTAPKTVNLD